MFLIISILIIILLMNVFTIRSLGVALWLIRRSRSFSFVVLVVPSSIVPSVTKECQL
jgi:hypothetical protein